jgi:hypothetical protein
MEGGRGVFQELMGDAASLVGLFQRSEDQGRRRQFFEQRIALKASIREKEKRPGVTLVELYDIIGGGSDNENRAAQCTARAVSLGGRA